MTLLVYDDRFLRHEAEGHPECPERLVAICRHLKRAGLFNDLVRLDIREADRATLGLVHPDSHIDHIRRTSERGWRWLDPDTYVGPDSYAAAALAVGGVVEAVRQVVDGAEKTALCLIRPPGHHAEPQRAMGFCLFNSVAVAAEVLAPRRVLIVDWDVHHGNGTQAAVGGDARIFYLSSHLWPHFPGTGGPGHPAPSNVINLPLGWTTTREEFLIKFEEALDHAFARLAPEVLLISSGFDALATDPLGGLPLVPGDFATLTKLVCDRLAPGTPIVSVLEGGYDLAAIGSAVEAHLRELMEWK